MDITRLIITDNKIMADNIAEAFGYDRNEDAGNFHYEGGETEILWTGGDFLNLILKKDVPEDYDLSGMSAEEITSVFYDVHPRREGGLIPVIDEARISYIENALKYNDEIVFMCQPTAEGERLIQAIKMFFGIKVPTRTITLHEFVRWSIISAVDGHSSLKLAAIHSLDAMDENLSIDMAERKAVQVNYESVSPLAIKLLNRFCRSTRMEKEHCGFQNKKLRLRVGGLPDLNLLYAAMEHKYDMVMDSLWDSLLYLYAEGLITNPVTHLRPRHEREIYTGHGDPGSLVWDNENINSPTYYGAILPLDHIRQELINLPYDAENAPDDFMSRTSVIYSFIVEQKRRFDNGEEFETEELPSDSETTQLSLIRLTSSPSLYRQYNKGKSIRACFGNLVDELRCTGLVEQSYGKLAVSQEGWNLVSGK